MKRREFIRQSMQSATTVALTAASYQRILGANDRVRLALIGCGGRGSEVASHMRKVPGAEYVAVCDVYAPNVAQAKTLLNPAATGFGDFRRVLESKDIDAVHVATPDHWHAAITVLACRAGKDVYVEKPLALTIRQGRQMVEAARQYKRVVQTGMQQRSAPHYREVERIIQAGELGEVRFVRVWNYSNLTPNGIGNVPDAPVPEGLDWDMYLGPAPQRPFNRSRFLSTFRWFWDYAGGTITDYGTHRFDTVQQIMHVSAPKTVSATGARFTLKDNGEMPDVLQATYEYDGFVLSYEAVNLNAHGLGGRTPGFEVYNQRGQDDRPHGEAYYGTNGALFCDRIGFEIYPEPVKAAQTRKERSKPVDAYRMSAKRVQAEDATALHTANFIECVRSRKAPNAEVEIGHRSTTVPHLGNIAYKTGRKLVWDAVKEDFVNDAEASKLLSRAARKPWDLI
ncbi:MAG: Gfo/Idh/MocA family oxidoreductase [Acidobacteria bacterium]|nr:Gfo/Idh/MocA family oxidoreductase [Acidobacteriota bacterium]MBI3426271.1 Gfo/Idh/MocA family oxidoreductase [Acidobacteriota bacterium]